MCLFYVSDIVNLVMCRCSYIILTFFVVFFDASSYPLQNDYGKIYFHSSNNVVEIANKTDGFDLAATFTRHEVGGVKSVVECALCRLAMDAALWRFETPDRKYKGLFAFIIQTCINLHIEETEVCVGVVKAMKNETQFLLANINVTGEMICGLITPLSCKTTHLSWNENRWVIPLPKRHKAFNSRNRTEGKAMKVLQISDLHIDLRYTPSSQVNCNEPLCCRQPAKTGDTLAGYWGSYGYCDTPYWTAVNFLEHVSQQKFDYILWTGDLPAHDIWNQSRSTQEYLLKNLTSLLLKYFPDTPIFPALGNHESYPVNSFPPDYVKGYNGESWLYGWLGNVWAPWLNEDALASVKKSGYYTALIKPGLRIVSLNMNYCNNQNYWMLLKPRDPNGELQWLVNTLYQAELNGELVQIIGHIPPTIGGDCLDVWRNNYYNIVTRFRDIIRSQFFGHTHSDQVEVLYSNSSLKEPISTAYICPSVTTFVNLNPGYRVYDIDDQTFDVLNYHTYILNLTKANLPHAEPEWEFEYSAKETYNLTSLSATSWDGLYQSWLRGDEDSAASFQNYYQYYYKSHPPSPTCDSSCRKLLLCSIAGGNFTLPYCD